MSAESAVPTFRDALTGLWARFDPERLATQAAFRQDPALVWGWYRWRAARVCTALPHAGHAGIAALAAHHRVQVVTQNVDDLHERAGTRDVLHLHGSLFASRCLECAAPEHPEPITHALADIGEGRRESPPVCGHCAGPIRPGVVWFGETLPDVAWRAAVAAVDACELLLVVGTSGLVHPAAALPALARESGARVLEINPDATPVSDLAHACWRMPASAGIARLADALRAAPEDAGSIC